MDRILEIAPDDLLAVVEPGILNAELNDALAPHGLWFAPDPAAAPSRRSAATSPRTRAGCCAPSTASPATPCSGSRSCSPTDACCDLGHRSVKGVTGLDLTALVVGSEGRSA